MKKIKKNFDQKDRVICVTEQDCHKFYYQPVGSKERILLFMTDEFSSSVFGYFRDHGRCLADIGFSLTIKELYEFKSFHNKRLTKIINRIPIMVEYVLKGYSDLEVIKTKLPVNTQDNMHHSIYNDNEFAA